MLNSLPYDRKVTPLHAFIASSLATFREEGVLNYAIVTKAMENVGRRLRTLYGLDGQPVEVILKSNKVLRLAEYLEVEEDPQYIFTKILTKSCNICPRAVGGLELPGRLCPFPGLLSGLTGLKPDLEGTKREGDFCKIILFKV